MKTTATMNVLPMSIAILTLAACAELQDGGEDSRQGMTGLVVDGRIANGLVWADRNNNGRLDRDFEPYAFTDAEGFYSYNPNTDTNYCERAQGQELESFEQGLRHCLFYGASTDQVTIWVRGGTDLDTGEPLKGSMSMRTSLAQASQQSSQPLVLSPITTLLERAPTAKDRQAIRELFDINDADLRTDFSNEDGNDNAQQRSKKRDLYANAVAIQTMTELASQAKGDINSQSDVLRAIALQARQGVKPVAFDSVAVRAVMVGAGLEGGTTATDQLVERAQDLNQVLRRIADDDTSNASHIIRTSQVMTNLVIKEHKGEDVDAVRNVIGQPGDRARFANLSTSLIQELTNAGNDSPVDLASLGQSLVSAGKNGVVDHNTGLSGAISDNRLAQFDWPNRWLVLTPPKDDADNFEGDAYLALYLAENGRLSSCTFAVLKDADLPADVNTEHEFIGGSWSTLGSGGVSLLLNYKGIEYDARLRALQTADDQAQQFRLSSSLTDERQVLHFSTGATSQIADVAPVRSSQGCLNLGEGQIKPYLQDAD